MIKFETKYLVYIIDEKGNNIEFTDKATGKDLLKKGHAPCSFIVKSDGDRREIYPEKAGFDAPYLNITYTDGHWSKIMVTEEDEYLTFELVEVSDTDFRSVAAINIQTDIDYNADSSFVSTLMGRRSRQG